jgi:hypothetical protein
MSISYTTISKPSTTHSAVHNAGNYKNNYWLLNEDGSYLLNEDGTKIVLEEAPSLYTSIDKPTTTYTTITKPS